MIVLGIDPGLSGAVAMLGHRCEFLALEDIPLMQRHEAPRKGGVKNQVNCYALRELLQRMIASFDREAVHVALEMPIAFPGQQIQTVASSFLTAGHIEATITSLRLAHTLIRPADWKKALKLSSSKEQARAMALRRWPQASQLLARVRDHNRAEALLIAAYAHKE